VRMAWIGVVEASPPFRKGRVSVICVAYTPLALC